VGRGAKKDFETNLGKFGFKIVFFPSKVEGAFAVKELISWIEYLNKEYPMLQVIVITRGGGSWESLQAFNSEELVKAIAASKIPVISAIGHEDDMTLIDYVCDMRASTPTHAAKLLSEPWSRAEENIIHTQNFLYSQMSKKVQYVQTFFSQFEKNTPIKIKEQIRFIFTSFTQPLMYASGKMQGMRKQVDQIGFILLMRFKDRIARTQITINSYEKTMALASPRLKLRQGYSITRDEGGRIIKDIGKIKRGDIINTQFSKGSISAAVNEIKND
jgi:exodeoxyribonuclease VII large subunit